ncbi:TBC1 domain family member 25 like protein [Argiope bruennichi]|uniref:TBC1 domain family member 25 like protein n=1 Tax=Argiope bruennichi TaxID=94029 RepID=A0A8T0EF69_ARGBR|nr:TBC1 domain family member 25 like protein [Argiope bruennichi]
MTYDMSDILDLHLKPYVKVKAKLLKKDTGQKRCTAEHFTIDPQTINYIKLRNQLARLFSIEGEFTINFKKDKAYIPLTSDWDLDGAISEASKPSLCLTVELQKIDKTLEEWDIICPADIINMDDEENFRSCQERKSLAGSIISHMESAMMRFQRAFSIDYSNGAMVKPPMDDAEYNSLLDKDGRVVNNRELHMSVFRGGVEPSMRPVIWKHLLNVFPQGLTLQERNSYLSSKCEEYYQLRYRWQHLMRAGTIPDVLQDITTMVRKDVRRTDRTEKFYSGSDDNNNVRALFNILTTYAVNHPSVSYCQGMSDLLSPILYIMKKESEAYVCFCGLMKRTRTNFKLDGRAMKMKFRHLQKMVRFYDPELFHYLEEQEALDLLFCYRWLLLDLKREFPYQEMLGMMEVLWGSLPPRPPQNNLELYDVKFPTEEICNALKDRTTAKDYLKLDEGHFASNHDVNSLSQSVSNNARNEEIKKWQLRVRRESMARNLDFNDSSCEVRSCKIPERKKSLQPEICQSWSCGEVFEERPKVRELCMKPEISCETNVGGRDIDEEIDDVNNRQRHGSSDSNYSTISEDLSDVEEESRPPSRSRRSHSEGYMSDDDSKEASTLADDEDDAYESDDDYGEYSVDADDFMDSMAGRQYEEVETYFDRKKEMLPPPHVLGDGNPFLLFMCIAMIKCHREEILKQRYDFNELAIHFDRYVRKHKVMKVLPDARSMFTHYLNMGWDVEDKGEMSDDLDS